MKLHGGNEGETEKLNSGGDRKKRDRGRGEAKESNWNIGIERGRREEQVKSSRFKSDVGVKGHEMFRGCGAVQNEAFLACCNLLPLESLHQRTKPGNYRRPARLSARGRFRSGFLCVDLVKFQLRFIQPICGIMLSQIQ